MLYTRSITGDVPVDGGVRVERARAGYSGVLLYACEGVHGV